VVVAVVAVVRPAKMRVAVEDQVNYYKYLFF
jgi:hypothetical protein